MRYNNYNTQYETNPFAGIQPLPYISQRVQFPFEDYMRTLQLTEQNREKALAEKDQLDLLLGNIETIPGDISSQQKLDQIKTQMSNTLDSLNYADPAHRDKLRSFARQIYTDKDLQHISEFTNAYKAANLEKQKYARANKLSVVADPTLSAFDENGNPQDFYGGWQERLDREKAKMDLVSKLEQDITTELRLPNNLSSDQLFATITDIKYRTIAKQKVIDAAELYMNSPEGKQEIAERIYNGENENSVITSIAEEFGKLKGFRESIISDKNAIGNPGFNRQQDDNISSGNEFYNPYSTGMVNPNDKFSNASDVITTDDNSDKGVRKKNILAAVELNPKMQKANQDIAAHLDKIDPKYGEIFKIIGNAHNNGVSAEYLTDPNIVTDNWESVKETSIDAINGLVGIFNKVAGKDILPISQQTSFNQIQSIVKDIYSNPEVKKELKVIKDYFDTYDALIEEQLINDGSLNIVPVSIDPLHESFSTKDRALNEYISSAQAPNFIPINEDNEFEDKSSPKKLNSIYRVGSKLIFEVTDSKGIQHKTFIDDIETRNNILRAFNHPGFTIANDYRDYTGVEDGKFKISGSKDQKIPDGYEVKKMLGEDNKLYYNLFKNGVKVKIPYYYDATGRGTLQENIPIEDFFYIPFYINEGENLITKASN